MRSCSTASTSGMVPPTDMQESLMPCAAQPLAQASGGIGTVLETMANPTAKSSKTSTLHENMQWSSDEIVIGDKVTIQLALDVAKELNGVWIPDMDNVSALCFLKEYIFYQWQAKVVINF